MFVVKSLDFFWGRMEDSLSIQKALTHPKLLEDAHACQVIWARVKGYPFWPVS